MKHEVVLRWIRKADNDLRAAEYLLKAEEPLTDIISFHCQQAVEKYLKAYLTSVDARVKKTHDLEVILNQCIEKDREFEELDSDKISRLSFYAVGIRYPEEYFELSAEEVEELFETAVRVREFVMKKLKERGILSK